MTTVISDEPPKPMNLMNPMGVHIHLVNPIYPLGLQTDPILSSLAHSMLLLPSFPQIFLHGAWLGGSDDLAAKIADGTFSQGLQAGSSKAPKPLPEPLAAAVVRAQEVRRV
jgi:hypothetical protein